MSTFKDKLKAHTDARTAKDQTQKNAALDIKKQQMVFNNQFTFKVSGIATPVFKEFAAEATEAGYPAQVKDAPDGIGRPMLSVSFVPEAGGSFGINASQECAFVLRALTDELLVEQALYYDQRPGKNGVLKSKLGLDALCETNLRRDLHAFLDRCLASRSAV